MKMLSESNKKYMLKWIYFLFFIFVLGVIAGAVYLSFIPDDKVVSIKNYLTSYLNDISVYINYKDTLKTSLINNLKIFVIIFLCSFSKPASFICMIIPLLKGFFLGFTISSYIRFFSFDGIFLSLCFLPASLVLVSAMIFYASFSIISSNNDIKRDKKKLSSFLVLSFCYLTIFCVGGFIDTFSTTTFMKIIYSFLA